MLIRWRIFIFFLGLFQIPLALHAQEKVPVAEESAEVFLDGYSDDFQENFFEALKQKGIENYDRAIVLLLKCKQLDPENSALDHELAKAYFGDKKYVQAQEYAIEALSAEPENLWYLNTLEEILQIQGGSIENISSKIPFDNDKLKENLALVFFRQKSYEAALKVLKDLKPTSFTKELSLKINDSVQRNKIENNTISMSPKDASQDGSVGDYMKKIEESISSNSMESLEKLATEALESYPSHPLFYYAQGYALNRRSDYKEAIEVLESSLDYLLDDVYLANRIYQELADAYAALDNISKSNMYLRKIKSGF